MPNYNLSDVRGDGLSYDEAKAYADSGRRMSEIFACDITGIMQDYEDALNFIEEVVVFGDTTGFILSDWNFTIVGCEDGNILHMRVDGEVVEV